MIYQKSKNTYFATPKENPKDLITLEVGDSKQTDFFPQQKICRWDNEVNVSFRLVHDEQNPTVSKQGDKIKWQGEKVEAEIYPLEEGQEFEIILKEKPLSNVVQFTIQDKDVEYFYQPALTEKEIAEGAERPENVIGSYAVYASENKVNYVGGKEYKTGKVGHIFRPRIEDSNGDWVWGELKIENGLLSVTIPQDFLDKAVYPVRHAAGLTFGYTTAGASYYGAEGTIYQGRHNMSDNGTGVSMSCYTQADNVGRTHKMNIYDNGTGDDDTEVNLISNGATTEITPDISTSWRTANFVSSPTFVSGTDYRLSVWGSAGTGLLRLFYDNVADNVGFWKATTYGATWPNPVTGLTIGSLKKWSIYCTYTASGGTNYPLTTEVTAFTLTNQNSNLKKAVKLITQVTAYTLTGVNILAKVNRLLTTSVTAFTLTGVDILAKINRALIASVTSFTLTPQNANLIKALKLITQTTTYTLTGIDILMTYAAGVVNYILTAEVTQYTLTTVNSNITIARKLLTAVTSYTLTTTQTALKVGRKLLTQTTAYTLTGIEITIQKALKLTASVTTYTFTTLPANLIKRGRAGLTILGISL